MFHLNPKPRPPCSVGRETAGHAVELLGDHQHPGVGSVGGLVQLLEEVDGIEVLAAAELVGHPLALVARVVEVEHRRHPVHPQPVDVVLLQPEQRVGDEEVADLVAPVVEDERAPLLVRPPARVLVLVEGAAVEAGERPGVAGEVPRHPVEDHPDATLVEAVDQDPEVVGSAEPGGRRVVRRHLVAPRAAEGMLGHGHQLDVGEAHVLDVGGQLGGELTVGERPVALLGAPAPRRQVQLVDGEGPVEPVPGVAPSHPLAVTPPVAALGHHARRPRRLLGGEGERVGALAEVPLGGEDLELVALPGTDAGHEQLPDPRRAERPHRVGAAVPAVDVAHHPDRAGVGSPHRERGPRHPLVDPGVRPQHAPEVTVAALADEVEIELAQGGREPGRCGTPPPPAGSHRDTPRLAAGEPVR